jgi:poly(beta-D-mannuronate) lyase
LHFNLDTAASFLDVAQRREQLKNPTTPRLLIAVQNAKSCSADAPVDPPVGKIDIPRRYISGGHGEVDPRESALSQPYYKIQRLASDGANRYVINGDHRESACVLDAVERWAAAGTLHNYDAEHNSQAWDQVGWTVSSLSLSISVIQNDVTLDPAELKHVTGWLHHVTEKLIEQRKKSGELRANENNLSYWRGLAATSVGILSNDDQMFTWGVAQYYRAIGQLDKDGSWPLEMERKELALHYQSFALEPLVMIAELAARQHIDLYGVSFHGRSIRDAVTFLSNALKDPKLVEKHAGTDQKIDLEADDFFSWLEFWNSRFGPAGLERYLDRPWFASRLSGSTTLYAAPPNLQRGE